MIYEATMNDNSNKPKKMRKKRIILIAALLLLIITGWTIWGNVTIGITHYSTASSKIPRSFDGYRIAVVSDFHNAQFGNDNERIIELVKKEAPDIIAITGDLVDSSKTDVEIAAALVKRLVEIAPCYM